MISLALQDNIMQFTFMSVIRRHNDITLNPRFLVCLQLAALLGPAAGYQTAKNLQVSAMVHPFQYSIMSSKVLCVGMC
jgi:hypothetical protein